MISLYDSMPTLERWQVRFLSRVLVGDGCWGWTGHHTHDGYSRYSFSPGEEPEGKGQDIYAHVALYEMLVGPVPFGKQLDHMCRNRGCVNHDHLEPVTHLENLRRRDMICKRGHSLGEENRKHLTCGKSVCLTCYNAMLARNRAATAARGHKKLGRRSTKPNSTESSKEK